MRQRRKQRDCISPQNWYTTGTSGCTLTQFVGMLSELIGLFGVVALHGGFVITVIVLLIVAFAACIRLYLLLRKAEAAREELIAGKKDMEAAVRMKSEFLVDMGYGIRTPLNALTSFTEILTQRVAQNCSTEFKEETEGIFDIIKKNSQELLTSINGILDYIKIDANLLKVESVPTSIKQIIHDVCRVEKPNIIAKHLALSVKYGTGLPPVILGDPVRIRQILANLVSNATKFTEKGTITIFCECLSSTDSVTTSIKSSASTKETGEQHQDTFSASSMQLKISVTDTGVGLSPAQIQELFKPYRHVDSPMPREHRAGLGLNIAMRLATLMDGTINIESVQGQGSTFSLLLNVYVPEGSYANMVLSEQKDKDGFGHHGSQLRTGLDIRVSKQKSDETAPDTNRPLQDARILIVEDMAVNQAILATLLREAGAQTAIAENGAIGVQKVMQDMDNGLLFDVVLMDMQMPVMDGYEATAFLRKHGYQRPIVAVTAHALSGDREKTLKAGCDDYIAKPIDHQTLIGIIRKYLDRSTKSRNPGW